MSEFSHWVNILQDALVGVKDEYEGRDIVDEVVNRAIESLEADLREELDNVLDEHLDEECSECDHGVCTYCNGEGECGTVVRTEDGYVHPDECFDCNGDGKCPECDEGRCNKCDGEGYVNRERLGV